LERWALWFLASFALLIGLPLWSFLDLCLFQLTANIIEHFPNQKTNAHTITASHQNYDGANDANISSSSG
jgi:hypothetical protein